EDSHTGHKSHIRLSPQTIPRRSGAIRRKTARHYVSSQPTPDPFYDDSRLPPIKHPLIFRRQRPKGAPAIAHTVLQGTIRTCASARTVLLPPMMTRSPADNPLTITMLSPLP